MAEQRYRRSFLAWAGFDLSCDGQKRNWRRIFAAECDAEVVGLVQSVAVHSGSVSPKLVEHRSSLATKNPPLSRAGAEGGSSHLRGRIPEHTEGHLISG